MEINSENHIAGSRGHDQPSLPEAVDVVIIGAGIVGSAAAYQLSRRGQRVLLLDKGAVAAEQSGRNLGFIRQQGRDSVELPLALASTRLWRTMTTELDADIEWVPGGNLALATNDSDAERYRDWARVGSEFGLDTRTLTMSQVQELVPGIPSNWVLGLFTPSDGHADPIKATAALAAGAVRAGAKLVTGCVVNRIIQSGGRVVGVETERGRVRSDVVVCAAGIWSHRLLASVGVDLPQRVVRNTLLVTEPVEPITKTGIWTRQLAFRQTVAGKLVLSSSRSDVDVDLNSLRHLRIFFPMYLANRKRLRLRFRPRALRSLLPLKSSAAYQESEPPITASDVRSNILRMESWFPRLAPLRLDRAWAGLIDGTADAVPVLDALDRPHGLIIATGQSGHGFALGPIFGVLVADLVTRGKTDFDLQPMRLARFAEGSYGKPKSLI